MEPSAELGILKGADGSASFSSNGISVLASVNGPLEVQRRDEIPDEAAIEVVVRPAAGVGSVRERHFESIIHKTLRHVIRVDMHPRTLIQVTLQVTEVPDNDATTGRPNQAASMLYLLPPLLNAMMLALLSTSIPLSTTMASVLIAVLPSGSLLQSPDLKTISNASSIHVITVSSKQELLLVESEGLFDMDTWDAAVQLAESTCCESSKEAGGDINRQDKTIEGIVKDVVASRLRSLENWRERVK